jgi:hypothetical protein
MNKDKTVAFQIVSCKESPNRCEVEVIGKSSALALGNPAWVERHRLFIETGFDEKETLSVLVSDFEPMLRTTPELFPINDELFEYIGRKHDGSLRVFQDKILASIVRLIGFIFERDTPKGK